MFCEECEHREYRPNSYDKSFSTIMEEYCSLYGKKLEHKVFLEGSLGVNMNMNIYSIYKPHEKCKNYKKFKLYEKLRKI